MSFKFFCLLGLLFFGIMSSTAHAKYTPEQVKAVYIYRIASFIQWNNEQQMSGINICIPDDSVVREILIELTKNKEIRNKPLSITSEPCDVLYISDRASLNRLNDYTSDTVLISDIPNFSDGRGAIELAQAQGRIKPKVNLSNVGSYSISSNFLRVADVIGGKHEASQ